MTMTVDELVRLAWLLGDALVMKRRPGALFAIDPTRAPAARLRSALEEVAREVQHLQMAANSEAQRGDELAADAKRYRWLRDSSDGEWAICHWYGGDYCRDSRAATVVDAAIDAAMQQAPEQEN